MSQHCCGTIKSKSWPYHQYYIGERDKDNRRNEIGENHWSGAKSLEKYSGQFLRNTMHGVGEYYWRYVDNEGDSRTYEGHFYCNQMHGYGTMSYSDGRVFDGLFYSNLRWGPGIESYLEIRQNVGLWLGDQLIRLAWIPPTNNLILDLMTTSTGRNCVDSHRALMIVSTKTVSKNISIDLLNQYGSDPYSTAKNWHKLYPKNCTDKTSFVFPLQFFDEKYYGSNTIQVLIESDKIPKTSEETEERKIYFAWNNNEILKHMMKHSFLHQNQQLVTRLNLSHILTDSRKKLKAPAKHELDCRSLLMASYLGQKATVVQLINDENLHPDLTDMLGNSVLMYATCGDNTELIHFLVEAGASINNYNDSCCTALSIALMRFVCISKEITMNEIIQALIPETNLPRSSSLENVLEWNLSRENLSPTKPNNLTRNPSKIMKTQMNQKIKSFTSLKTQLTKGNLTNSPEKLQDQSYVSGNEEINNSIDLFSDILGEYTANVTELYLAPNSGIPLVYIFEVTEITNELLDEIEDQKKVTDKNVKKGAMEAPKSEPVKPTSEALRQSKDYTDSINLAEKSRLENCEKILSTIVQLLLDGADPNLVHCPQPALFMAVVSQNCNLVKHLIHHGANVNECYSHVLGYSPLDIAVSYQLSMENLNVIHVLLESGADAKHRLPHNLRNSTESLLPGPTLLHAVLAKTAKSEAEKEVCYVLLDLLLTYNCSPVKQFSGRSALDIVMTKGFELFNTFISHPKVDLNAIINQSNQTILSKIFTIPVFKTFESDQRDDILTNLLLHGANPLKACQNEEEIFKNIFIFAKKFIEGYNGTEVNKSTTGSKGDNKGKKNGKSGDDKNTKQKTVAGDIEEYKHALQLVADWARLLYIRWLRVKFVEELIVIVNKYKHRHWNVILKLVKNTTILSLWLTPDALLEVWTNMNTTKKRPYDKTLLKHLIHIIVYCCRYINKKPVDLKVTADERSVVEKEANILLRKYNNNDLWLQLNYYNTTDLMEDADLKYDVCFECFLPLNDDKILCNLCGSVSFCTYDCMKLNIDRTDCHPCSDDLKDMYFPVSETDTVSVIQS